MSAAHTPLPTLLRTSSQHATILKEDSGCDEVLGESMTPLGSMFTPELAAEVVRRWNEHARLTAEVERLRLEVWQAGSRFNCMVLDKPTMPLRAVAVSNDQYLKRCAAAVDTFMLTKATGRVS